MRPWTFVLALVLTIGFTACGDNDTPTTDPVDDTSTHDAGTPDATEEADVEVPSDIAAPEDTESGGCEHPCLNEFDQSDKKLCPDPKSDWSCEEGCCIPVFRCSSDVDCAAEGFEQGQCTDPTLSCVCDLDTGSCYSAACSSTDQCAEGSVCAAGACVEAPPSADVLLDIVSRPAVLVTDASVPVLVEGHAAAHPDLRMAVDVTWSSDAPSVIAIDDAGVATGGASAGEAVVTATHSNGASASLTLRNVVPALEAAMTVIVVSEGTLSAPAGHFAVVDTDTGTTVSSGALPEDGVLTMTDSAANGFDVHIFSEGHDWVSHLGVTQATLLVPVAPTMWGRIVMDTDGGLEESTELIGATVIQGEVDMGDYDKVGEVELTLSALPFSASLFDFNLESILGASVQRYFHPDTSIPGIDTNEVLDMPGGLTFAFAGPAITTYVLNVPPGEPTIWTLGGRIGLDEVFAFSDDIFEAFGGGNINFGELASYLMPFFSDFWSGMTHTPVLSLDDEDITTLDTTLRVPLDLQTSVQVPMLPALGDLGYAATVFAIGGALTGDELFYPLGLAAAGDTSDETKWPADGIVDGIEETPEQDPLSVSLAPLHTHLGGPHSSHAMAVVALSIRDGGDDPRPEGGSAILARQPAGGGHLDTFADFAFLDFTMQSSWDEESREVSAESVEGSDTVRLLFKGKKGDNWAIWLNGRAAYTVPAPTTLVDGMTDDRATDTFSTLLSNFDLSDGVTLDQLRQAGSPTLDTLLHTVDRTSFVGLETLQN